MLAIRGLGMRSSWGRGKSSKYTSTHLQHLSLDTYHLRVLFTSWQRMALGIIRLPCTERDKEGWKCDGVVQLEFGCHVVSEAFSAIFQLCDCEQINHLDPWAFGFSSSQMDIIVTGSEVILFAHIFMSFPLTSNIYGYYGMRCSRD